MTPYLSLALEYLTFYGQHEREGASDSFNGHVALVQSRIAVCQIGEAGQFV